ncbi:superoxide dismutase [bacterium]|nr:superoxide dismutase [bacterium]
MAAEPAPAPGAPAATEYAPRDFSKLLGMPGFSGTALSNHFKLYQGYVSNTKLVLDKLNAMVAEGKQADPACAELRRRLGWEWNGMRLHELYFENLGGTNAPDEAGALHKKIVRDFGGFDAWKKEFIGVGKMRGIGWVILYEDTANNRLINVWVNEHDVSHLAGAKPILVMDVFEHAFMPDYQLERGAYIDAFFSNIDWSVAEKRMGK